MGIGLVKEQPKHPSYGHGHSHAHTIAGSLHRVEEVSEAGLVWGPDVLR